MKYTSKILSLFVLLNFFFVSQGKCDKPNGNYSPSVVIQQVKLDPNNIESWILNTGIFNQDLRTSNTPGFQWPKGSGKFAIFTAGLTLAAYINNELRLAVGSYKGEYAPGYVIIQSGVPVAVTNSSFKIYKVSRNDNMYNNPDWLNWGLMVPYGAPFIDHNHNNIYEPAIDTPGIRGAVQTIFVCLTDGFPEEHKIGEGFGGGTPPMFAEVHLTAWGFDNPGLEDAQFLKWDIINKNVSAWNSTYFGIVCDPDLGFADDDYIGYDTSGNLAICYNADDDDAGNSYSYGPHPPAVGIKWLKCYPNSLDVNSFVPWLSINIPGACAGFVPYSLLKGFKNDGSWWLNPKVTQGTRKTKFVFSGGVEAGWTELDGIIDNCGGDTTGNIVHIAPGDRRFVMAAGGDNFTLSPNQSKTVMIAQLIARGSSNLNSVTLLKQLSINIQNLCDSGFLIGVNNISSTIPNSFVLYQNYPNPFNPVTKIKFSIPLSRGVSEGRGVYTRLIIYDILGREIAVLVNNNLKPGTYEANWDASNYSSGLYFYSLITKDFTDTKKMVLMK